MSARAKKSPITAVIKRSPGQSIREQVDALFNDEVLKYLVIISFSTVFAGLEWYRYFIPAPPQPVAFSIFAFVAVGWAFWKLRSLAKIVRQMKLGLDGEQEVGQLLADMFPTSKVFHDIIVDKFNIDHALISDNGVFSIETKTRSKYGRTDEKVIYDGKKILVDGFEEERDALVQAKANAKTLGNIILEQTGKKFNVTPVIVFPGWWVESRVPNPEVVVQNPKMLPGIVRGAPERLTKAEIVAISEGLKRHQQWQQKLNEQN